MNLNFFKIFRDYQELSIRYDADHRAIWYYYNPSPRPCFSITLLKEIRQFYQSVIEYFSTRKSTTPPPIRYLVMSSQVPGIFNLGGDLALFSTLIKNRDRQQLLDYGNLCIELCYLNAVSLHLPITTISLVEGTALGGGFESALASNILIATENAEMGLPEIRFNLFPGMSAYSFLARTCGMVTAEKIITSGAMYSARELYEMGVVHHLVGASDSTQSVEKFIRNHNRSGNGRRALQLVAQRYQPIDYQELADIVTIWVDAALRLKERDLLMMDRLVKAQIVKMNQQKKGALLRTIQDRRFVTAEAKISFPLTDWSGETIMFDRRKSFDRRLMLNLGYRN
jgi:DSF synthase